jgi:phosphatidylinositol alpha-1,6-mannosyltransferase
MASPERYKGHDAVMNAWPLIRAAVPDATLAIVGTGADEERLRRRVRDEHLEGIRFTGRLSDQQRDLAYCSSRLLFYPSQQEGFGLAGIEAASFGVPFMALAGTVTAELFPDGNGIVLAKDLKPESIAEAAIPVLTNSQLASRLGAAARKRVHSTFLEEHFAKRFRRALAPILPVDSEEVKEREKQLSQNERVLCARNEAGH